MARLTPASAGCWIDGHHGIYAYLRIIDIATEHGYEVDPEDVTFVEEFRNDDYTVEPPPEATYTALTWAGRVLEQAISELVTLPDRMFEGWHVVAILEGLRDNKCTLIPDATSRKGLCFEIVTYLSEDAEHWLNEHVAPSEHSFGWHDGEWFLWPSKQWQSID